MKYENMHLLGACERLISKDDGHEGSKLRIYFRKDLEIRPYYTEK